MKNNPKLESFLSKLTDPALPVEQQSFLLSTENDQLIGGDNEKCSNWDAGACAVNTKVCTNYGVCADSENGTIHCTNKGGTSIGGGKEEYPERP